MGLFFGRLASRILKPFSFYIFFVSIRAIIIKPEEFWGVKIIYWFEIITLGFAWVFTVAFILSSEKITFYTRSCTKILEIVAGYAYMDLPDDARKK
jgi:threonine/homoserine/homoserine lactone efflux protein